MLIVLILSTTLAQADEDKKAEPKPLTDPKPLILPKEPKPLTLRTKRGNDGVFSLDGLTARGHPSGHGKK
uniref:Uncharacterized protein n=1 Tax=Panagrolaimus sp. PS1159 TaxID=55785 RepID=A0AC35FIA3_9BILA